MAGLRDFLQGVAVVSEEGDVEKAVAAAGSTYWLVDPLDGTKQFVRGSSLKMCAGDGTGLC
jgi:3'-phosphoadenosine 5'-phosphosulfate (PAPS) 3'-phosphatase